MSVNPERKNKQVLLASVGIVGSAAALYAISQIMAVDQTVLSNDRNGSVTTNMIAGKTEGASPEMSWITNGRERLEKLTKEMEQLTRAINLRDQQNEEKIAE